MGSVTTLGVHRNGRLVTCCFQCSFILYIFPHDDAVFRSEVDRCACGGRLKLVAFVTDPAEARRYLTHVRLPAEAPRIAPARDPPQAKLAFEGC